MDITSEIPPIAAPLANVPKPKSLVAPPASNGIPVTASPFAASTVPAAKEPKCTVPLSSLPHHVLVIIGSSSSVKGVHSGS